MRGLSIQKKSKPSVLSSIFPEFGQEMLLYFLWCDLARTIAKSFTPLTLLMTIFFSLGDKGVTGVRVLNMGIINSNLLIEFLSGH